MSAKSCQARPFALREAVALRVAEAVHLDFEGEDPVRCVHSEGNKDGFLCDFDLPRPLVPDDLPRIAARMSGEASAFKLLKIAGVYPDGDEKRPMLQRIYGVALASAEELSAYLAAQEEAERRDHRKLGREMELFFFHETAPGMPYWMPKGFILLNQLIAWWREVHEREAYQEVSSPLINSKRLWEISGHWEHYRDDMFVMNVGKDEVYGVKPMNCPNAMVIFNQKLHSYRDLPLRLSDCDALHRHERSGSLHGLLRVQKFQQDDAHIFIADEGIEAEFDSILKLVDEFYRVFGLSYRFRLATRPLDPIGDDALWSRAEGALHRVLRSRVGDAYEVAEGDGAFYGPKIDILIQDALGRDWQMGTLQLDYQLPRRFECQYVDREGKKQHPVVIHRVIYGSLERFIGILIEHCAGKLPLWLAPLQLRIVPVSEKQEAYAREILAVVKKAGIRAEIDRSEASLGRRIKQLSLERIPYALVLGAREEAESNISVRMRGASGSRSMKLDECLREIAAKIAYKSND